VVRAKQLEQRTGEDPAHAQGDDQEAWQDVRQVGAVNGDSGEPVEAAGCVAAPSTTTGLVPMRANSDSRHGLAKNPRPPTLSTGHQCG
jgi:hypothetical protein